MSNRIKNLATGDRLRVNEKFKSAYGADNLVSLIIFSNHSAVKLGSSDRRYCALDVSDKYVDDRAYFNCLHAITVNYLRTLDISTYSDLGELKSIGTEARTEHIVASLPPFYKYLKEAYLSVDQLSPFNATFGELYTHYKTWFTANGYLHVEGTAIISRLLKSIGIASKRRKINGKSVLCTEFTPQQIFSTFKKNNWIHETDDINSELEEAT